MFTISVIPPGGDISESMALRLEVFQDEQGYDDEFRDEVDDRCYTVIIRDDAGDAVATARVWDERGETEDRWRAGKICVRQSLRGHNLGRMLMDEVDRIAQEGGAASILLNAQEDKAGFYQKAGYEITGELFMLGTPHYPMVKTLCDK